MLVNIKIKGYEIYCCDEKGNVFRNGKKLNPTIKKGYKTVNLCVNNKRKTISIHRIVAFTFLNKTEEEVKRFKLTVNHKDGNKLNNDISNLEWCTSQENLKHAWENELHDFKKCKVFREKDGSFVAEYRSIRELCKQLKLVNRREVTLALNEGFSYIGYNFKRS